MRWCKRCRVWVQGEACPVCGYPTYKQQRKRKQSTREQRNAAERRRLREKLRAAYGDMCWLCGELMTFEDYRDPMYATLEHVVRARDGGTMRFTNMRLTHKVCNRKRA